MYAPIRDLFLMFNAEYPIFQILLGILHSKLRIGYFLRLTFSKKERLVVYQPFLNQPKPKLNQKPNHLYGE